MIISLLRLADFGFYNTFVRVISYGFGGKKKISTELIEEIGRFETLEELELSEVDLHRKIVDLN